jgi:hypothetical protein
MRKTRMTVFVLSLLLTSAAIPYPQAPPTGNAPGKGEYLVEEVARCGECHTPRDAQGNWDQAKWLQGAAVWFRPIKPSANWAYSAPRLAGLPSFSDDQARTVLVKGIGPNGLAIRPPMHPYHLSPDDANAIIGYLRSGRKGL